MKQHWIIVLFSLWIALVPFLGFPSSWKTLLIVISALIIAGLSLRTILEKRAGLVAFSRRIGLSYEIPRGTSLVSRSAGSTDLNEK